MDDMQSLCAVDSLTSGEQETLDQTQTLRYVQICPGTGITLVYNI
jgi:hypothetical protein